MMVDRIQTQDILESLANGQSSSCNMSNILIVCDTDMTDITRMDVVWSSIITSPLLRLLVEKHN
jgi:hypothetical protein